MSDIDLVVVGDFPQHEFTREIRKLEGKLNREINFTTYTQEEFQKKSRTEGSFLSEILAGKKILIKGALKRG